MCTTQFHFITYNTHLFFQDVIDIGPLFEDEQRREAISLYLRSLQPNMINIAALQEVWWAEFAHEIFKDALNYPSYINRYVENDEGKGLNKPGLMLLADSNCNFKLHHGWESYKSECGELPLTIPGTPNDPHGWNAQDFPVWKGKMDATGQFQCSEGDTHTIGLFTTHMPVGYDENPHKVHCSFDYLAKKITKWRSQNPGSAVILLGDLNIDALRQDDKGKEEYAEAVGKRLIGWAGLTDAAGTDQAYATIVPSTNLTWQYFNNTTTGDPQRIDYFMYANSTDGTSMTVQVDSINVNSQLTFPYNGESYACSDHYPLEITATITVNE